MKVVVLGSTGHVGTLVVQKLLGRGDEVIAFVHSKNPYQDTPGITVVQGDVHNPQDIAGAIKGANAVISALGSWHTKQKDILSETMKHLVPQLERLGPKRLITLTGSDAQISSDVPTVLQKLMRPIFRLTAPKILHDSEAHMRTLQASKLDWTVVRSPVMRSLGSPSGAKLHDTPPQPWTTVHRLDVANALVSQLDSIDNLYKAPHIY